MHFSATSRDADDNTCVVNVVIPGIKKPGLFGWRKNTEVDVKFDEQAICMIVELQKPKKSTITVQNKQDKPVELYLFEVKRLPDLIVPDQCTYKVKANQIELILQKQTPRSWAGDLATRGLETYEPEDS